jgi:hypothetical protein
VKDSLSKLNATADSMFKPDAVSVSQQKDSAHDLAINQLRPLRFACSTQPRCQHFPFQLSIGTNGIGPFCDPLVQPHPTSIMKHNRR